MPTISQELLQLGAVAIIFILFIREFFKYLKERKTTENGNKIFFDRLNKETSAIAESLRIENARIAQALQEQNQNHLVHIDDHITKICESIIFGNQEIVKAITDNGKLLTEIRGILNKK